MKINPVARLGLLGAFAVASAATGILLTTGGHTQQPTQVVIRQDANTAAVITSAPPTTAVAVAPRPAATSSAVKRPAVVQEAPVVTNPTDIASSSSNAPAPAPSGSIFFEPIKSHAGPGNVPSSTSAVSIPTATTDPAPSN